MSREAVIIGYSGHAYVLVDILLANGYYEIAYCEKMEMNYNPYNLTYLGVEYDEKVKANLIGKHIFLGIGENQLRSKVYNFLSGEMYLPIIKDPSSSISSTVTIGDGTIIMPGSVINALSTIGLGVICNSSSVIEHNCIIGNFVHIAPGAVIAGNVTVGDQTFIGANSVIRQGIKIGANVIIGAGAVVVADVPDNSIVFGNPAKIKKNG
jgi:sugar O-acyltransferase (sialic acid O-acetyltransferase NeuD family)